MNQKLTLESVKTRFLNKGFKLLSRSYHNNKEKLRFKCLNCGLRNRASVNNLKKYICKCTRYRIERREQMLKALQEREHEKNNNQENPPFFVTVLGLFFFFGIIFGSLYTHEVIIRPHFEKLNEKYIKITI
jgi:hypothetical protein